MIIMLNFIKFLVQLNMRMHAFEFRAAIFLVDICRCGAGVAIIGY